MSKYSSQIYAGVVGKSIGVRLGAPIEPYQWTYDRIKNSYGDITGYIKDSNRFAADDDTNGPLFFVRAYIDNHDEPLALSVGKAWLNYARPGQGMFWWGGDGVSTEHTAYLNLKKGLNAPESGSMVRNTQTIAEQVGGQIFIDSWGLIHPGNIEDAMRAAHDAASVSHDGDGLVGASFIAGLIAGAFTETSIYALIDRVIALSDQNSEYIRVLKDVYAFFRLNPDSYEAAYAYVVANYSYDHYAGACHIIPNACIVLIGLLYGMDDFARSVEITCMCGWDTDSNAGVVGTILGVLNGIDGIPWHYREPLHDVLIASSMSPTLNNTQLPNFAWMLDAISEGTHVNTNPGVSLDFRFKGSWGGLRVHNDFRLVRDMISKTSTTGFTALIDNLVIGDEAHIYYQTFYQKSDFGDNRYDPVFAPQAYSGQELIVTFHSEIDFIDGLTVNPYVYCTDGQRFEGKAVHAANQQSLTISYIIPDTQGALIKEVGIKLTTQSQPIDGNGLLGRIHINQFDIVGGASYRLNEKAFELGFLDTVTPFSFSNLDGSFDHDVLTLHNANDSGLAITGDYYTRDLRLQATLRIIEGTTALLPFRVKGLENYLAIQLDQQSARVVDRENLKTHILDSHSLKSHLSGEFDVILDVKGNDVVFTINECVVLNASIRGPEYGHFGFGVTNATLEIQNIHVDVT